VRRASCVQSSRGGRAGARGVARPVSAPHRTLKRSATSPRRTRGATKKGKEKKKESHRELAKASPLPLLFEQQTPGTPPPTCRGTAGSGYGTRDLRGLRGEAHALSGNGAHAVTRRPAFKLVLGLARSMRLVLCAPEFKPQPKVKSTPKHKVKSKHEPKLKHRMRCAQSSPNAATRRAPAPAKSQSHENK
jgi:hypothetical protein